ncbi:TRF2-interacting telomeric protein/Rap1 C terminal domain-containing protein [Hypoxylon cercidicola]|nr:TRF2-interacting telomeric protein/Rap1 C terminal domain-containing protein [Hypoxylon cercidicola]
MPAPIVYEGAARPSEPLRHGMFKDKSFWVAHRIPQRLNYVQTIQNNGGKVVPSDKHADYLIADPFIKDAVPLGSYSYQWIDDSVKNGALQNPEEYLCQTRRPRAAGSAVPKKGTRVSFTEEDDMILRRWVTKKEQLGKGTSGNAIYQELAEQYPQHPWNSWRDRWVKKLQNLPSPEVPDAELSPPQARQTAEPPARPSPSVPRSRAIETGHMSTQNSRSPRSRNKFTQEDDDILIQHIRECLGRKKPLPWEIMFRDLAKDFPHHTEQSWKDRWLKQLKPKYIDELAQWKSGDLSEGLPKTESEPATRHVVDRGPETAKTVEQRQVFQTRKDANVNSAGPELSKPHTPDKIPTRGVAEMKEAVETEFQDDSQQRSSTKAREKSQPQPHVPEDEPIDLDQSPPSEQSMKKQFHADYQAFADLAERPFVPFQTIKGRTFELWDLWQAIASQKMVPEERDWRQIAEQLGFDWVQHTTVHDELRKCYEVHLAEFEEATAEFDADSGEDEDEDGEEEDEEGQDPDAPLPSSPPRMPSLKRSLDSTYPSTGPTYPESPPKRRRVDRNEVPSTPDHVNGTSHLRRQSDIDTTPSKRADQGVDDAAEDESQDTVHDLPPLPRGRKKAVEPETQDFRFDPETQNIIFETEENAETESQCNITPSQQLHLESDATLADIENGSPTPKAGVMNTNPLTPTPRRSRRIPFRQDSDDEKLGPVTTSRKNNAPTSTAITGKAKRRSLPKSFAQKPSPIGNTSASASRRQAQSPFSERAPSVRRSTPAAETPEDVIDRFCSLGYPRKMVLQALRATTWRLGDAGQVMEMLKQGKEVPQRTHGVWTQRDDDALKLVTSDQPPRDEKEERKRARARKRLEAKHGTELMELRRRYLWEAV